MTKRILAVVMALVLGLSLLSVNIFAADLAASISLSGTTVTVKVDAQDGATRYDVNLYRDGANTVYQTRTLTAAGSVQFTNLPSGSYSARVTAYDAKGVVKTADTSTVSIPNSGTTSSGTITYTGTTGTVDVSWTAVNGTGVVYEITATYRNTNGTTGSLRNTADGTTKTTFELGDAILTSISITYTVGTGARQSYGTVNVNANGNSGTTTGSVWINGTVLSWVNNGTSQAIVTAYSPTYGVLMNRQNVGVSTSYNFSSIAARYTTIIFTVENYYNGVYTTIGTATYNANSSAWYGSIRVTPSYDGSAAVTWNGYTGATGYVVQVSSNAGYNSYNTSGNSYTVPYTYGIATTIVVYATSGNNIIGTVGSATIDASGNVSYTGGSSTNNNTGTGSTITGTNCYLVVGTNSSVLTWSGNATLYNVLYTVNGQTINIPTNSTTVTIPVGASTSFSVMVVIANQGIIAQVQYTAPSTPSSTASSSTQNLKLAVKDSTHTTVSWDKVSGATMYQIEYARIGSYARETYYTTLSSYDLPFGKSVGFEVYVYAYTATGITKVGTAVHKAGDEYETTTQKPDDNKTDTTKPAETKPAYVTNFKGTVGTSGSITLSWSAASGSPTYEIYYKKSTSSTWNRIYSTTSRSLKINKLTNGTSYDFKVVANGRDSGILTMTIGTTSSTKTAADPGSSSSSATPSISSVSGGKGTITVSWNAVSGANLYRVYIAEDGSTTYKTKTGSWSTSGTSITLSGVSAGSYKVRIKVSTDNGKTWTNLADCDYRNVTVS